jgi:hypothetical protein
LYGAISSEEKRDELKALDANELQLKFNLSDEEIKAMGYNSAKEFETAFDEGLANWSPEAFKK